MNYRNHKKNCLLLILSCCAFLYAQEDQISLPDVTTVITGDNSSLNIPAPEMNKNQKLPKKSPDITCELPEIREEKKHAAVEPAPKNPSFIIEGKIGGGYPAAFIGNVLIKQSGMQNPFSIMFNHDSVSGFGGNSLTRGFNASDTDIYLFKRFELKKGDLELSAFYGSIQNGFQSQVQDLSSVNQNIAKGTISFGNPEYADYQYKISLDTDFYSRYNDITNLSTVIDNWQEESALLSFMPAVSFETDFFDQSLSLNVKGTYNIDMDVKGNLVNDQTIYTSGRTLNRGELNISTLYALPQFKFGASLGFVASDHQNDNKIIVPFSALVETNIPLKNGTQIRFKAQAGLESHKTDINSEEKKYKYTAFSVIPEECTNWFAHAEGSLPFGKNVTFTAAVDYKNTALGNGFWEADYSNSSYTGGLFAYSAVEKTLLSTDFSAVFMYNNFSLTALAKINFIDLKPLESRYNYDVSLVYTGEGRFGGNVQVKGALDAQDIIPEINLEGMLNLSEQQNSPVKLAICVQDAIKLVTGTTRIYAGDYISESGKVSVLIKFRY